MIRLTAKAVMTSFHATYVFLVLSLGLFTVVALQNANGVNLLMSLSVFAAGYFGLIAGTTLVEIKVKPLSYMLPGQERSMAPVMLLIGTTVCAAYAILVLMRPMSIVDIPAPQQSLAAFGFSLGLFMLVVAACVVTRSTVWLPLVVVLPAVGLHLALLLPPVAREAIGVAPWLTAPWLPMNAALVERPLLSLLFAALGVGLVFSVLGNRALSRHLCGAPFMPLKAYDNPLKFENYRSRMRRASFRPSVMTDSRSPPGGALLTALSRRLTGTSWDYLVLDTRPSRNVGEIVFRLVSVLVPFVLVMYAWSPIVTSPLYTLFFLVALTSMYFAPTFKPSLSPMLPVDRRRYFRSFIAKGISVYGFAVVGMLLLQLVAERLPNLGNHAPLAALAEIAELPFKGVLLVAATIPIVYWAHTKLRSTTGFFLFSVLFLMTVAVGPVALGAYESLMRLSYPVVLLVSALCWLPFIYIAWKRCHHDDLLLP